MKPDLFQGKLCCSQCHHLISMEEKPEENCPYCKKRLFKEEQRHWEKEEEARRIIKRKFKSPPLEDRKQLLPENWGLNTQY